MSGELVNGPPLEVHKVATVCGNLHMSQVLN